MDRPPIQQLSPSVVNKIAAGEVIERPASLVKELMENAVDAGASRVDVAVEAGGIELVRVSDDGCGIPADQLTLALASHATSKLRDADDLFRVATLGFRGEALASIASVSQVRLRSRPRETEAGAEIECLGGALGEAAASGGPPGTTIEVRRLFYNTPVRRKFLRTKQTEMGHCAEALTRIALAHPDVHFSLSHNGRPVHELPPAEPWLERIAQFFGRELAENLIWVESEVDGVRLWGYVANPSQSRGSNRMQYLFLNGRAVRDRALQHALGEAYRGLLMTGRYPIAFLAFEMPPELVDVNVHPTKREVRFQHGDRHYAQLLSALRDRFLTTDLTARLQPADGAAAAGSEAAWESDNREADRRREIVEWAKEQTAAWPQPAASPPDEQRERTLLNLTRVPRGPETEAPPEVASVEPSVDAPIAPPEARSGALQVQNRYLVTESDEGMVIVDQHALHERILYELLREKVLSSAVESQKLLVPEPVDLASDEAATALEHRELLAQLGLMVEPFGGDTVIVSGYPAMLANLRPAELLRELVEALLAEGKAPDRRDVLDRLLHMIACKAAIKAGDRLAPGEVEALLEQRHLIHDTHHCPHGRPTALVFTRDELDRQFKRT